MQKLIAATKGSRHAARGRYLQEVVKPAIEALLPLGLTLSEMARRLDAQGIAPSLKPRGSGKWYSPREGHQGKGARSDLSEESHGEAGALGRS